MRFCVKTAMLLLFLAVPAAQAQLWLGPVGLEVRAVDPKGHPLAGAQLQIRYTAIDPKDGPAPVVTDSRGRANVSGLAEGTWTLEVSHEGYMTYVADVALRRSARPEVLQATQLRVPGATRLMRVEVYKGPSTSRPIAPTPAPVAPTPPAPAPTEPSAPEPTPVPTPAPVPAAPAREPEPKAPVPEAAPPERPAPAPAPVPPPSPPVEPAAPPPAAVIPVPAPVTPPAPVAPAVDATRLRSAQDRNCPECPPGESAISVERVVPPGGGPGCGGDIAKRLAGGEAPADLPSGCHVLRIALPAGARYTAYRFEVQDGRESRDCQAAQDCANPAGVGVPGIPGIGRWPINPALIRKPEGTVILAPFEAGPAERERRAVLTVYYTTGKAR